MKVIICTEEFIKTSLIPSLKHFICKTINRKYSNTYNFQNCSIEITNNNHFKFHSIQQYDIQLITHYVSPFVHKGQAFADIVLYVEDNDTNANEIPARCPDHVIEITKNDHGDSGNQMYQRLTKFAYLVTKYGLDTFMHIEKSLLYDIGIEHKTKSVPWEISLYLCHILNINVYEIRNETLSFIHKYKHTEKSSQFLLDIINSTRTNRTRQNNRVHVKGKDIFIHVNLMHNKNKEQSKIHDPNTGFVTSVLLALHVLNPKFNFYLKDHNLNPYQFYSNEKLWICLYPFRNRITFENNDKDWSQLKLDAHQSPIYCVVSKTNEKLVTMCLHRLYEPYVIFSNHAGCEKSNIVHPYTKKQHQSKAGKGIPDIIILKDNTMYVIEGEMNKPINIQNGLKQLNDFQEWITDNVIAKWTDIDWNQIHIEYKLATYGGNSHPNLPELCFSLLSNGEFINLQTIST